MPTRLLKTQAELAVDDPLKWATAREAAHHPVQLVGDPRSIDANASIGPVDRGGKGIRGVCGPMPVFSTLAEIREAMDEVPPAHSDAAYAAAFLSAGLEPEHGSPRTDGAGRPSGLPEWRWALRSPSTLGQAYAEIVQRGPPAIDNRRGCRPRPLARPAPPGTDRTPPGATLGCAP